ncbi:hypothetical protein ACTWKC_20640 [Bacillus sp. 4A_MP3]|uniref:hypothetical protein n=1 Tax=Bacillus TaxID=1386 RepID=UPI001331687E|nr:MULTISPECIES: hypothetical protein [Bacillus amyloliquefaciens group]MDL0428701.1 hypothetical protein [Bacillus amyloliquefaciens]NRF33757.1 hypothetical protein [Bacillus velezensis]
MANHLLKRKIAEITTELSSIKGKTNILITSDRRDLERLLESYYWASEEVQILLKKVLKEKPPEVLQEAHNAICDGLIGIITGIEIVTRSIDVKNSRINGELKTIGEQIIDKDFKILKDNISVY